MKTFFLYMFAVLGVIFVSLLAFGAYFFFADPLGLRTSGDVREVPAAADRHPYLSPAQEAALETFGINPAALPTEVTPEMRTCAEAALGEERVAEIESGDSPTPTEIFRARHCVE